MQRIGVLKWVLFAGAIAILSFVSRFASFPPIHHGLSSLAYTVVDDRGMTETSLFNSSKNSKLPLDVLQKALKTAATRHSVGCGSKPSALARLLGPTSVLAQSNCQSPCEGYYNKTCNAYNPDCPGNHVCCYDENNEDQGCMGVEWACQNGGSKCGQSECDN